MVTSKTCVLLLILGGLLLVSCSEDDSIERSVQETLTAVAQTEAVLTDEDPTDAATAVAEVIATPPPPTAVIEETADNPPPTAAVVPTNTNPPPPTATTAGREPPDVSNNAPGGTFPQDETVYDDIIVDPAFLFRADIRDLTVGESEGEGIVSVDFFIYGNEVNYHHTEESPGFCVFGGGEPTCNPWPQNDQGQFTWGVGGPVVEGGDYFAEMIATTERLDGDSNNILWNWNFDFSVTLP